MQPDTHRKDSYGAGYVPATVSLKVASRLSGMKTGFGTAVNSLVPIEIQMQGILNVIGTLPTLLYPFYYNFGRQIWAKKTRGIVGTALTLQAQALKTYYTSLGLSPVALIKIALDCFGLVVV